MKGTLTYQFTATVWRYEGPNGWYFVSLPITLAEEIRQQLKWQEEGWGRLKAKAQIGSSNWETAIWFDTKLNTYLLPIKASIRKQEGIDAGFSICVVLYI